MWVWPTPTQLESCNDNWSINTPNYFVLPFLFFVKTQKKYQTILEGSYTCAVLVLLYPSMCPNLSPGSKVETAIHGVVKVFPFWLLQRTYIGRPLYGPYISKPI